MKCILKSLTVLVCLMLPASICLNAQTHRVDSLRFILHSTKDEEKKLPALLAFCDEFQSLNRDTAYYYALMALRLAEAGDDPKNLAHAQLAFANSYYVWGWIDSTLAVTEEALKNLTVSDSSTRAVYFRLLRQKGLCYGATSRFAEGLEVLYRLLREATQYKDSVMVASTMNTMGSIHLTMGNAGDAKSWIRRSLEYHTHDKRFRLTEANILTNLANVFLLNGQKDSALLCIHQALPISRQVQNLNTLATTLRIQSAIYTQTGQYADAEAALIEMQKIRQLLTGASNVVEDNIQLATFYASTGQLNRAIKLCLDNLAAGDPGAVNDTSVITMTNRISLRLKYYEALAGFYLQSGNTAAYQEMLESIIAAKDSFYEANSAMAMAEMQTKYEVQEKEKTILHQQFNLTRKNFLLYGSLVLLVMAGFIFFLLFREYRRRQKLKMEKAMQEEKAASVIAVKEAEEKERKRIAADLHDNLGVQANAILYNSELLRQKIPQQEVLVEDLHDTAQQMLLNLRETLWAMKTNDIAATDLWLRVINFCQRMGRHYRHIRFAVTGSPPKTLQLPSVKALHVIMVIQEAIQNAVKHSGADSVEVSSYSGEGQWKVEIHDDGKGFRQEELSGKTDSHGLINMKERAAASELELAIESSTGRGTSVILTFSPDTM